MVGVVGLFLGCFFNVFGFDVMRFLRSLVVGWIEVRFVSGRMVDRQREELVASCCTSSLEKFVETIVAHVDHLT
jgi:hypothetical protein